MSAPRSGPREGGRTPPEGMFWGGGGGGGGGGTRLEVGLPPSLGARTTATKAKEGWHRYRYRTSTTHGTPLHRRPRADGRHGFSGGPWCFSGTAHERPAASLARRLRMFCPYVHPLPHDKWKGEGFFPAWLVVVDVDVDLSVLCGASARSPRRSAWPWPGLAWPGPAWPGTLESSGVGFQPSCEPPSLPRSSSPSAILNCDATFLRGAPRAE